VPACAQYGGPAILSRGEAPTGMVAPELNFRPFVEVNGVYSTGLSSVKVDETGNIANQSSAGMNVTAGVSGSHSWRHTILGLSFRGGYSHYFRDGSYDSTDASLLVGVKHELSRHVTLSWNNSLGVFNRDAGLLATLSPAVPFDPSQSVTPVTDFFNNRTYSVNTRVGVSIQRSTRSSIGFTAAAFDTYRASSALVGTVGLTAAADYEYRLSSRMTIGAAYNYSYYSFTRLASNTNTQSAVGDFAYQLSRRWEFSGFFGVSRAENKFIQNVPVDPAIAAIIGISESTEILYRIRYAPDIGARISRTFHKGVLSGSVTHGITPGNGLFLTSEATSLSVGYTYTGLRRWSFGSNLSYMRAQSFGNVTGVYSGTNLTAHISRQLMRHIHFVASVSARKYGSPDFFKYNQGVYTGSIGLGWSPGEVPLRIW
jgi:hypothetical protein